MASLIKSLSINKRSLKQSREEYFAQLQQSLEDTKNGNVISFTIEEFDEFIKKSKMKNIA
jgi:hypothetical protein